MKCHTQFPSHIRSLIEQVIIYSDWEAFLNLRSSFSLMNCIFNIVHQFLLLLMVYHCINYWKFVENMRRNLVRIQKFDFVLKWDSSSEYVIVIITTIIIQKMGFSRSKPSLRFCSCRYRRNIVIYICFNWIYLGLITDNRFDQFCAASMTGGYQAQVNYGSLFIISTWKVVLFRFARFHLSLLVWLLSVLNHIAIFIIVQK